MDREEWINQAKHNAKSIEREIERLKNGHRDIFRRRYKEFWDHVKEINNLFKNTKPLLKEDREELWKEYQSICEEAKESQQREKESRRNESRNKREVVESKIRDAYWQAKSAQSESDLSKAKDLQAEAMRWMKDGWSGFNVTTQMFNDITANEGRMTKEDREHCWEKWKEVNELIKYRRQEIWESIYHYFRSKGV